MLMNEKIKKCVGIIFGGQSNEHDISIASAKSIYKSLKSKLNKKKYTIKSFYITKNGIWLNSKKSDHILKSEKTSHDQLLKLFNVKNKNFLKELYDEDVDIWFPVLHGSYGEDGTIQGLLKFTKKPVVGSGILGSALGMDKIAMKFILSNLKIPQVKYLPIQDLDIHNENDMQKISLKITDKFHFPLFIKPANSGSSIGITKVNEKSEIFMAINKAQEIDSRIIIEEGINARELECGIIGKSNLITSKVGEVIYESDWYDYASKYVMNNKIVIPAEIDLEIEKTIKNFTTMACKALNIYGFARADFFLEKYTNKIYLNEINTIPGFTDKSMFPMLWKESGLEIDQLIATLLDIACKS